MSLAIREHVRVQLRSPRRGAIDVARMGALVIVVLGHLLLAVIDRGPDGEVRGANLLTLHPGAAWLAAFAPMPVFFAAGGWANATATVRSSARRLRAVVGLGALVVIVWSLAVVVTIVVAGEAGVVADGARVATQPLWFLAAYLPFAAAGRWLARAATRPVVAVGGCLVALAVLDGARFLADAPDWIGWPGFAAAWATPWLVGAWWRQRWQVGWPGERRVGSVLAATSAAVAAGLAVVAGYHVALIDAVPGERSNTTPPTLYTAVAGLAQVGLVMVSADALDRVARRGRRVLDRSGEAAVAVYAWHLTALALVAGLIAVGLPVPDRLTVAWWLARPVWFAGVLGVTGVLVAATAAGRRRLAARPAVLPPPAAGDTGRWSGVVLATTAAGVVGLEGPATWSAGAVVIVGFGLGWWFLGAGDRGTGPEKAP